MMSHSFSLGQRLFSSLKLDLTLSLQASALVQHSERQSPHDPERLKELLCSGNIWVSQTPELKLNIRITSEFDPHPSFARFVSQLGDIICKEKMWSDLGLTLLHKSCLFEPGQTSSHILSFGIQKLVGTSAGTKAPKVPKILRDASDAIPPVDISTVYITCVDVSLVYYGVGKDITRTSQEEPDDRSQDMILPPELGDCDDEAVHYLSERISTTADASDSLFEREMGEVNQELERSDLTLPGYPMLSEFSRLFQDALKALVLGKVDRRRRTNQTGADGFHSLATIAPSVFKPGYREAINQRSRLMPSIAKSLASMLKHSDNQALKDKLASARQRRNSRLDSPIPVLREDEIKGMIKTRLWTIAQRRLYHAPTPKHPKPSTNARQDMDRNEQAQDEDLFFESVTEGTNYFEEDDTFAADYDPDIFEELCPDYDGLVEDESTSIIMMQDEHPAVFADDKDPEYQSDCSSPFPLEETDLPSPDIQASILSFSEHTESDHEMLDLNSDFVAEDSLPSGPNQNQSESQTSFSQSQYSCPQPYTTSCEGEIPTSQASFSQNPSLYIVSNIHGDGFEDLHMDEMICD